jgi:hypothetical protein
VQLGAGLGILFAPAKEIKLELKLVVVIAKADLDHKYQGLSEDI